MLLEVSIAIKVGNTITQDGVYAVRFYRSLKVLFIKQASGDATAGLEPPRKIAKLENRDTGKMEGAC